MHESEKWRWSRSVMSDSSRPHGLQPTRLLWPWKFPGKSTGVGAIARILLIEQVFYMIIWHLFKSRHCLEFYIINCWILHNNYWSGVPLPSPTSNNRSPIFFIGLSWWLRGKKNAGDVDSIPGLGRSPGDWNSPLQYSCLGNPMERGAWWPTVHGVTKELDMN